MPSTRSVRVQHDHQLAQARDGVPMSAPLAEQLLDLARQVDRLRPDHRDPHRFHEIKSEVEAALRRLAAEARDEPSNPSRKLRRR